MVNNEWDDILYWKNYEPFQKFTQELDRKYFTNGVMTGTPPNPDQIACWQKERDVGRIRRF